MTQAYIILITHCQCWIVLLVNVIALSAATADMNNSPSAFSSSEMLDLPAVLGSCRTVTVPQRTTGLCLMALDRLLLSPCSNFFL